MVVATGTIKEKRETVEWIKKIIYHLIGKSQEETISFGTCCNQQGQQPSIALMPGTPVEKKKNWNKKERKRKNQNGEKMQYINISSISRDLIDGPA